MEQRQLQRAGTETKEQKSQKTHSGFTCEWTASYFFKSFEEQNGRKKESFQEWSGTAKGWSRDKTKNEILRKHN
jgi:hypothetical protein